MLGAQHDLEGRLSAIEDAGLAAAVVDLGCDRIVAAVLPAAYRTALNKLARIQSNRLAQSHTDVSILDSGFP